jgi:hypothetical protein
VIRKADLADLSFGTELASISAEFSDLEPV